ncbi:MAG TPA: hypothetical protein VGK40_03020 [Verrucomicrobiae bacterium]|jgi:O-antigen/teichoic acid export membrane protein
MSKLSFFRQSSWMLMTTVAGGIFMTLLHPILQKPVDEVPIGPVRDFLKLFLGPPMSPSEYSLYNTLIPILGILGIPATGLQAIFAQQTASAVTDAQQRQLRGTVRIVLAATLFIWLLTAISVFVLKDWLRTEFSIANPVALLMLVTAALPALWLPVLNGVMQGRQNFLWIGWNGILAAVGTCLSIGVIVRCLGAQAAGALLGVFLGAMSGLLICLWQTASVWRGPSDPFAWRAWLRRVLPLTLGLGATIFILRADMILVRKVFGGAEQTALYSGAGIIGRALLFLTIPMAGVMFPKIVRSAAMAEDTNVLAQALGATALLGGAAALGCTLFPALPLKILYSDAFLTIKPLVPWFAWCMLPLTLANVLINNLLARERFRVVPWLVAVAVSYGGTLAWLGMSGNLVKMEQLAAFRLVVQILGSFGLLLFAVSAWFTWVGAARPGRGQAANP